MTSVSYGIIAIRSSEFRLTDDAGRFLAARGAPRVAQCIPKVIFGGPDGAGRAGDVADRSVGGSKGAAAAVIGRVAADRAARDGAGGCRTGSALATSRPRRLKKAMI